MGNLRASMWLGLALGILSCTHQAAARKLKQATNSTAITLPRDFDAYYFTTISQGRAVTKQGITNYISFNENYTSFLAMAQAVPVYSALLNGPWSQGPSNNTVLIPRNEAIAAAFSELGQDYNVEGNVSRYLNLINTTLGLTQIQTPLQTLFSAILNSHIIFQPINLYASPQILGSSQNNPYLIPAANLSVLDSPVAYTDSNQTVFISQPTGLINTPIQIPKLYAQQAGTSNTTGNTTLYLYEVPSVLVASSISNGSQDTSTSSALQALSKFLTQ